MNKEDAELSKFFDWLQWQSIRDVRLKAVYHIANERKTGWAYGKALKRKGVKPGVPDVCVPIPSAPFPGLYIEFKVKPNKLTESQNEFCALLNGLGHLVRVAWSAEEAIEILKDYLEGRS